jgi:DNA-binding beta-propeller fold protein YncE
VALDVRSGTVVAVAPLAGVPDQLALAPASARNARVLYAVEAAPIPADSLPDECRYMTHSKYVTHAGQWTVLRLALDTLDVESQHSLGQRPHALTVAPDGDSAYALMPFSEVIHLDLQSGTARLLATLPSIALGLAVTDTRIYVSDSFGNAVRALDRSTGRVEQVIASGRHPTGMALARTGGH